MLCPTAASVGALCGPVSLLPLAESVGGVSPRLVIAALLVHRTPYTAPYFVLPRWYFPECMVRSKNVLNRLMKNFFAIALITPFG